MFLDLNMTQLLEINIRLIQLNITYNADLCTSTRTNIKIVNATSAYNKDHKRCTKRIGEKRTLAFGSIKKFYECWWGLITNSIHSPLQLYGSAMHYTAVQYGITCVRRGRSYVIL